MEKDENMKKKEKEENPVAWSNLGDDMQGEVMALLNPFDRIRFRAVCWNWFLTGENRNHRIEDKLPWLLTFEFTKNCGKLAFTLYDPIHTNPYLQVDGIVDGIQAMEKSTSKLRYKFTSKHGWVFFLFDREYSTIFFLFCPLTKQIMKLPPLTNDRTTQGRPKTFITFSTPPNSVDCVFFVVRDYEMDRIVTISTYRPGVNQKSDTWITTEHLYNNNREKTRAVYADPKGVLYLISYSGRLSTYIRESRGPFLNGGWGLHLLRWGRLLESNGDLLFVDVRKTHVTHVWKYDWVDKRWVRVNSLRDQALFMDSDNLFAAKVEVGNDQTRNIANKIHYISRNQSKCQPFVYDIGSSGKRKQQKSYDTGSGYYSNISNEISRINGDIIWIEPPLYLFSK